MAQLKCTPIVTLQDWQALPARAASPVRLFILGKYNIPSAWSETCLTSSGAAQGLLEYSAENGFGHFRSALLTKLLKGDYGVAVPLGAYSSDVLLLAIKTVLKTDDIGACGIAEARLTSPVLDPEDEAFLQSEEARVCLDPSDSKDVDTFLKTRSEDRDLENELMDKVAAIRAKAPKQPPRKPVAFCTAGCVDREGGGSLRAKWRQGQVSSRRVQWQVAIVDWPFEKAMVSVQVVGASGRRRCLYHPLPQSSLGEK